MKFPDIKEIQTKIRNHTLIKKITGWTQSHSFPGFMGVSLYDVFLFIYREIQRDSLTTRANSIAFSFFISLFPFLIALFTLIPYLLPFILNDTVIEYLTNNGALIYNLDGTVDFNETLITHLRNMTIEFRGKEDAIEFVRDITTRPRAGLLSFGFILAIFFASNGMMSMMRGFEKSYPSTFIQRNPFIKRIVALNLIVLVFIMLLASILFIILGDQLIYLVLNVVNASRFVNLFLDLLRIGIVLTLVYFGITLIYRFGAATIRRFRWFSPGATLATMLSVITTIIFSFYINNFGVHDKLYGSIGTVIVVMLWIQINALIVLIGFELNASIAVNKDLRAITKEQTPQVDKS